MIQPIAGKLNQACPLLNVITIIVRLMSPLHCTRFPFQKNLHNPTINLKTLNSIVNTMAIWVVKFWDGGYEIRKIFYLRINVSKGNYWILSFGLMPSCQKVSKFYFQSQFSMSKIIRICLNFFFIEEYQFRGTFFVIDIFWENIFFKFFITLYAV